MCSKLGNDRHISVCFNNLLYQQICNSWEGIVKISQIHFSLIIIVMDNNMKWRRGRDGTQVVDIYSS